MSQRLFISLSATIGISLLIHNSLRLRADATDLTTTTPIVAHRGASKAAPENTIPAFQEAWQQGADAIEGDFHLSKDGVIVCVHDANIRRYTGKNLQVRNLTLKQLKTFDFGKWHDPKFTGTTIPTLQEVLTTIPAGKKIYIEIKSDATLVPILLKQLKASELATDQFVIISFHAEVIKAVEQARPELKTFWLTSFKKDDNGTQTPSTQTILSTLHRLGTDGVSTHYDGATPARVKALKQAGYEYHVWTVDHIDLAQRLLKAGVQSITTNIPGKLRDGITSTLSR